MESVEETAETRGEETVHSRRAKVILKVRAFLLKAPMHAIRPLGQWPLRNTFTLSHWYVVLTMITTGVITANSLIWLLMGAAGMSVKSPRRQAFPLFESCRMNLSLIMWVRGQDPKNIAIKLPTASQKSF